MDKIAVAPAGYEYEPGKKVAGDCGHYKIDGTWYCLSCERDHGPFNLPDDGTQHIMVWNCPVCGYAEP